MNQANNTKVFSLNTNGSSNRHKRMSLVSWIEANHNGIFFLQETHTTSDSEVTWKRDLKNFNTFFSHGASNARGVCTLIPEKYNQNVVSTLSDCNGRFLLIHLYIDDRELVLVNIYAPTKANHRDQLLFLDEVKDKLMQYMGKTIITGGDFNTYINPKLDKKGGSVSHTSGYASKLTDFMHEFNLCDIFRKQYPDSHRYTWRNRSKSGWVHARLDMFLVSHELEFQNIKSFIHPSIKSDHSLIQISFLNSKEWSRGRGFYKFNVSLLKDQNYVDLMNNELSILSTEYTDFNNKAFFWDYVKCKIRGATISYCSFKAKENRKKEKQLLTDLAKIEIVLNESPSLETLNNYTDMKSSLDEIYNAKASGSAARSRADFINNNEKNSKYFLNKEKQNYNMKCIKSLHTTKGHITNEKEILEEEQNFY